MKTKRFISIFTAITLTISIFCGMLTFSAVAAVSGDWEYIVNSDGTASITKYNGKDLVVTVPKSLNGKSVTQIGDEYQEYEWSSSLSYYHVFSGSNVISVTIPDSVKLIAGSAFEGCYSLTSVTIPDSCYYIGEGAFYNCSKLTSVKLPSGIKNIYKSTFYGCSSLTSITIPKNVTSINNYAFYNCSSLTKLTIPEKVQNIGDYAFYNCLALATVTIPGKVQSIGDYAFNGCINLIFVVIKNGVVRIGKYAFGNYYSYSETPKLTAVTIPKSVLYIDDSSFQYCKNVTLYGIEGSYARTYADQNSIAFLPIKSSYTFDIKFSLNYSDAKKAPETQKITPGFAVKKPSDPKRDGYTFGGWYRDKKCTILWDFKDDIVKDKMTLYAKWVKPPSKPQSVKTVSYGAKNISVSWNAVSGVDGYEVYRASSKDGDYSRKGRIEKDEFYNYLSTGYSESELVTGRIYYYKVRAFKLVNGKRLYGEFSTIVSGKPIPEKPTNIAEITYEKEKGEIKFWWGGPYGNALDSTNYEIFRSTSLNGTYALIKTVNNYNYTDTGLKSGITYYYKVRGYVTVSGKKIYSDFSEILRATTLKA